VSKGPGADGCDGVFQEDSAAVAAALDANEAKALAVARVDFILHDLHDPPR
jgi:hypothetical protein